MRVTKTPNAVLVVSDFFGGNVNTTTRELLGKTSIHQLHESTQPLLLECLHKLHSGVDHA